MARSLYECFRSNNDTSDRRTKPFAKTHRHAIETRAISEPAPAATASQRRAPSRCRVMGGDWARAQVEMERQSGRGRIVPRRVFSRARRRVGVKCGSGDWMAWCWMSGRVRWWVLLGRTGMGMAPHWEARPPASLVGCVSGRYGGRGRDRRTTR